MRLFSSCFLTQFFYPSVKKNPGFTRLLVACCLLTGWFSHAKFQYFYFAEESKMQMTGVDVITLIELGAHPNGRLRFTE